MASTNDRKSHQTAGYTFDQSRKSEMRHMDAGLVELKSKTMIRQQRRRKGPRKIGVEPRGISRPLSVGTELPS